MAFGILALPFGLILLGFFAIAVILIIRAFIGSKSAGNVIAGVLAGVAILLVISIGALYATMSSVGTARVSRTTPQSSMGASNQSRVEAERAYLVAKAIEQERTQANKARMDVLAMEQEVNAKANEIRDRTEVQVGRLATVPEPADHPAASVNQRVSGQPGVALPLSGKIETESTVGSWSVSGGPTHGIVNQHSATSAPHIAAPVNHSALMPPTIQRGIGIGSLLLFVVLAALGMGFFVLVAVVIAIIARHRGRRRVMGRALAGAAVATAIMVVCIGLIIPRVQTVQHTQRDVSFSTSTSASQTSAGDALGQVQPSAANLTQGEPAEDQGLGVAVAGQPWTSAVEEFQDFEADVYPSMETAAEALGRRVGQRLMETAADDGEPPSIYVWRASEGVGVSVISGELIITRDILDAVAQGLRQKLGDPAYVSVERPVSGVAVNVAIQEIVFEDHNRWRKHAETRSGGLALRVESPDGPFSVSTRFAETPWVTDRTSFAREYANGDWLVAYSDGTHSTHIEARWDALTTAAEVLLPLARAKIIQMSGSDQHQFNQQMAKDPNWLRGRVADELRSRNLATDQFTQQFDRPYGPVWREAVLVNASPEGVEQIARSLVQGVNVRVTHQRNTWFSYIALALLVVGTYLFLNMATKGYYAWALRGALLIGLIGVVIVILNFA